MCPIAIIEANISPMCLCQCVGHSSRLLMKSTSLRRGFNASSRGWKAFWTRVTYITVMIRTAYCHFNGFPYRFYLASGATCQQTKHNTSHRPPPCATWLHATLRKQNRCTVRPLPYEKQADRTSSSGLRKISMKNSRFVTVFAFPVLVLSSRLAAGTVEPCRW